MSNDLGDLWAARNAAAMALARNEELAPEDSPTSCIKCGGLRHNGTFVLSTHISYDLEVTE